jgi:hypothetical protein
MLLSFSGVGAGVRPGGAAGTGTGLTGPGGNGMGLPGGPAAGDCPGGRGRAAAEGGGGPRPGGRIPPPGRGPPPSTALGGTRLLEADIFAKDGGGGGGGGGAKAMVGTAKEHRFQLLFARAQREGNSGGRTRKETNSLPMLGPRMATRRPSGCCPRWMRAPTAPRARLAKPRHLRPNDARSTHLATSSERSAPCTRNGLNNSQGRTCELLEEPVQPTWCC